MVKELYENDPDFCSIWTACLEGPMNQYLLADGYLFRGVQLCVPHCSLQETIVREAYGGGLAGHFGRDKTLALVQEHFFWPKMNHDVMKVVEKCVVCLKAKTHGQNTGLYTLLPIPKAPW